MKNIKTQSLVSVIVCTHNRGSKIANCLSSLLNQSYKNYEIIVVNDKSTDNTMEILKSFKTIKVLHNNKNLGLSASRNKGVKNASGEILIFTDDDCIADKNWIKELLANYENPKIYGVGGKIIPFKSNKWLLRYYYFNNPLSHLPFSLSKSNGIFYRLILYIKRTFTLSQIPESDTRLFSIVGANMSMRKEVFNLVRGFDENIKFGGDEIDFWNRLRDIDASYELHFARKAIIKHDFDSSIKDALRRNYSYGIGQAREYLAYKKIIPVIFPFPLIILFSILLVLINPLFFILSIFLTLLLYPAWMLISFRSRSILDLSYSFLQAALELTLTAGFIYGFTKTSLLYKNK